MAFLFGNRFRDGIAGSSVNETTGDSTPSIPPTFEIDLSLPPEQRYLELSAALRIALKELRRLLDDLGAQILSPIPASWLHTVCWLFLRHVYDEEQTRELRGISTAAGVPMYLLVLFNNVLDLLMGCTSGGARVVDGKAAGGSKMVHFRALDWEMPLLRPFVVQLHFRESSDGPVIASGLTYAGQVGVLTGVRRGFSQSQNFRSNRNASGSFVADVLYFWHVFMVLLGLRPSIASVMRGFLLPRRDASGHLRAPPSYEEVVRSMPSLRTAVSYLTFCNGQETTIFEKDHTSAHSRHSKKFIAITNHDSSAYLSTSSPLEEGKRPAPAQDDVDFFHLRNSVERRRCVEENWEALKSASSEVRIDDIVQLVQKYPTTNKTTHFACVMDPTEGVIHWSRRWKAAVNEDWIREHS